MLSWIRILGCNTVCVLEIRLCKLWLRSSFWSVFSSQNKVMDYILGKEQRLLCCLQTKTCGSKTLEKLFSIFALM